MRTGQLVGSPTATRARKRVVAPVEAGTPLDGAVLLPGQAVNGGGSGGGNRPRLLPLVMELKILTKDLQILRIGDVINHAQLDFVQRCERQLRDKGQIRMVVLKARQIGISTIIEAIAFVLCMLYDNFGAKIVSHEDKSSKALLEMTTRYWQTYIFSKFYEERYVSQNHLAWHNGADIDIATAKNATAGRSMTIQLLHASEVAFWDKAEVLMTGLNNSIPSFGLNCVFLESTANGVGNFFHKMCNEAMKGDSEYEFVFYPWHEHPEYTAAFLPIDQQDRWILHDLDDEEITLRTRYGISDSRLVWRRWAIKNKCLGSVEKFHQEFPVTPHEAFISTGRNVYPWPLLRAHYVPRRGKRGRFIHLNGRTSFFEDAKGYLTIYADPADDDWGVYMVGADPTHSTAGDYACAQVINRRTLEQVAVYRRKIDPVNFGRDLRLLGNYYRNAMIAPEKTGPGYATVGVLTNPDNPYPWVYATKNIAQMKGVHTENVAGWQSNRETKDLAVQTLLSKIAEPTSTIGNQVYGLIIHDEATIIEMRDYTARENGIGYENSDGSEYDDGVMALAIAVTVHGIEPAPAAYEMVQEHVLPRSVSTPTSAEIMSGHQRPIDNQPTDIAVLSDDDNTPAVLEAPWETWETE